MTSLSASVIAIEKKKKKKKRFPQSRKRVSLQQTFPALTDTLSGLFAVDLSERMKMREAHIFCDWRAHFLADVLYNG